MTGRVSEEVRYAVAEIVGKGVDTAPAVARELRQTKTTASHALRILTDDGYVERHRYESGAVLYRYKLVRMPPPPSRPRRTGPMRPNAPPQTAQVTQPTTTALERAWRMPVAPLPQVRPRYVKRPVGPI